MDVYVVILDPELRADNRSSIVGISARIQGAELIKANYLTTIAAEVLPDRDDMPAQELKRRRDREIALCAPHVRIENHELQDVE